MALPHILLLVLVSYLVQADIRCGKDWTEANNYCLTKCPKLTDAECPAGKYCFRDVADSACAPPPVNPTPVASPGGKRTLILKDLQSFMGRPTGTDLSGWIDAVNLALSRYDLNTDRRIICFLSQIRHETASMTVFHQPIDNGGGGVHMLPGNWEAACKAVPEIAQAFGARYAGCSDCSCIKAMAASPLGATATDAAKNIFSQPKVAMLSSGWWFDSGAQAAFGWKGCNQKLKYYCDYPGKGGAGGSDCTHTGNYQVTCCIFWTINEQQGSGLTQRNKYYDDAVNYAKTAWGFQAAESEELTQYRVNPEINAGIAIGCIVGIVAIIVVIVALYLKRKQRLQSEVV